MKIRTLVLAAGLLAGCAGPAGQEAPAAISFPHAVGRIDPFEVVINRQSGVFSYKLNCLGPRHYHSYNVEVTTSDVVGGNGDMAGGGFVPDPASPPQQCDPNSPLLAPNTFEDTLRDGQFLNVKFELTLADGSTEVLRRSYKQQNGGLRIEQP